MAVKLQVNINLDGKDNTKRAFAAAQSSASSLSNKITAISTAYLAFGQRIARFFDAPIRAAAETEKAEHGLSMALRARQQYTDRAFAAAKRYADQLGKIAGLDGDEITRTITRNRIFGFTEEQTEAVTAASAALAKVMGVDLATANQKLTSTLGGEARELKKVLPEVTKLTEAQLRNGEAIRLVQQRLGGFLASDAATTPGAFNRITSAIGDMTKSIGQAILEGVNLPGKFEAIRDQLEKLQRVVDDNREVFTRFGNWISSQGLDLFEKFVNILDRLSGMSWEKAKRSFMDWAREVSGFKPEWWLPDPAAAKSEDEYNRAVAAHAAFAASGGNIDAAANAYNGESAGDAPMPVRAGSGAAMVAQRNRARQLQTQGLRGKMPSMEDKSAKDAALKAHQQFLQEQAKASAEGHSRAAVELQEHLARVTQLEREAAKGGIDISKDAENLRMMAHRKFSTEYAKELEERNEASIQAWEDEQDAVARAMGRTTDVINFEHHRQLRDLEKFHKKGLVSWEEYLKRKKELEERKGESLRGTTGSESTDRRFEKATQAVNALRGGINGIIQQIGSMYGWVGQFVASIIQLLNQTKEEFRSFVDGLIQSGKDLPKRLVENLPYAVEAMVKSIPETLDAWLHFVTGGITEMVTNIFARIIEHMPNALGKVFSAGFWSNFATNAFNALGKAFQNLWSVLFTGKGLKDAMTASKKTEKFLGFGSDDPNAGEGEFKIKDADLRNQRRAKGFEDSFSNTVEDAGKSFTDLLLEAWRKVIDMLGQWFAELPGKIWNGLLTFLEFMTEFGKKIFEGLAAAALAAAETLLKWGGYIWDGFVRPMLEQGAATMGALGTAIWNGLKTSAEGGFETIKGWGAKIWDGLSSNASVAKMKEWGGKIWEGLRDSLDAQKFIDRGINIWNGLKDSLSGEKFTDQGKNIWAGLRDSLDANKFLDRGKNIWQGLSDKLTENWSWIKDSAGGAMAQGFLDGIYNAFDWLAQLFRDAFSAATGGGGLSIGGIKVANSGGMVGMREANPGLARAFRAMGALQFADGGMVPGTGFRDSVPALLTPGERVLSRQQTAALSGAKSTVINFNFHVAAGAVFDKDAVKRAMPEIIEQLRRESKNGTLVVRANGVA